MLREAYALLAYGRLPQTAILQLVHEGVIRLTFEARPKIGRILTLMEKYADRPMDFTDACLVVMSEEQRDATVITLDADFRVYRRYGRDVIPLVKPD